MNAMTTRKDKVRQRTKRQENDKQKIVALNGPRDTSALSLLISMNNRFLTTLF